MKKYLFGFLLSLVLITLSSGIAFAQDPTPSDDDVNAVAKHLYCRSARTHLWTFAPPRPVVSGAN